jgi:hypothetical protein
MDTAVLHFVKDVCAKEMLITWQCTQVKATETARSLRITTLKLGEVGVTDSV